MVRKIKKIEFLLTTPDLVVLSLLSERPMHGYDINLELKRRDVEDWAQVSRPQVYYSLKKLKSLLMISEASDSLPAEGPERLLYRVNQKGKRALSDSLGNREWATQRIPPPFLTWLALSTHTEKNIIRHIIDERRNFIVKEIQKEKATMKTFKREAGPMIAPAILMVEITIKQFETELNWLKKVEKIIISD